MDECGYNGGALFQKGKGNSTMGVVNFGFPPSSSISSMEIRQHVEIIVNRIGKDSKLKEKANLQNRSVFPVFIFFSVSRDG